MTSVDPVQMVVQPLRDREELRLGFDHHPASVHACAARVAEQRPKQLDHPTTLGGRVDVPDHPPTERFAGTRDQLAPGFVLDRRDDLLEPGVRPTASPARVEAPSPRSPRSEACHTTLPGAPDALRPRLRPSTVGAAGSARTQTAAGGPTTLEICCVAAGFVRTEGPVRVEAHLASRHQGDRMSAESHDSQSAEHAFRAFDKSVERLLGADFRLLYGMSVPVALLVALVVALSFSHSTWLLVSLVLLELGGARADRLRAARDAERAGRRRRLTFAALQSGRHDRRRLPCTVERARLGPVDAKREAKGTARRSGQPVDAGLGGLARL